MSENTNSLVCETYTRENLFDGVSCETYVDRGVRGDSAYKQAVDGGYTGTLEQFEALLAEDLNTLAANISNINTVISISTDVTAVAGIASDVSTVATNISNVNTAATNMSAIIAAPTAATNASTSAANAQTWAEGNDTAVAALGGEHSSKGWAQTAQYYAERTLGKNVGEVYYSQSSSASDNPGGLPLFTGETIANADEVYPDFYDWVADHSELQITAANYEIALSTYGECPKYVIDTVNKTIRLPKLVNYVKMANTTDGITQSAAGLPNITGTFGRCVGSDPASGAFVRTTATTNNIGSSGSYNTWMDFNASRSSSIYGNSNTVTPAHTTLFPWVCAYNAAVPASTAQAAEFQTALSGKADINLGNLSNAGKIVGAGLGMPSGTCTDLTVSASGTSYTSPADGYYQLIGQTTSDYGYAGLANNTANYTLTQQMPNVYGIYILIPVHAGDSVTLTYSNATVSLLRFVYAEGTTSLAS